MAGNRNIGLGIMQISPRPVGQLVFSGSGFGGGGHQLHQPHGSGGGGGGGIEGALLTGQCQQLVVVDPDLLRTEIKQIQVGEGKANFYIVPVLRLAQAGNCFVVPAPLTGNNGCSQPVATIEIIAGLIPLAVGIHIISMIDQLPGSLHCRHKLSIFYSGFIYSHRVVVKAVLPV